MRQLAGMVVVALLAGVFAELGIQPAAWAEQATQGRVRVALDFHEVDLPVYVRFMSELTGKNFVLDEKVTGKVTIFSPTKVTVDQAYGIFLSVLKVRRLVAVPRDDLDLIEIVKAAELPPERMISVHRLKHANAVEIATLLTELTALSKKPPRFVGGRPLLRPTTEFEAPVQVLSDGPTNSLLVSASKADTERLLSVVRAIDTPRKQVFVEAVIMEVAVDRLREIGTDPIQALGAAKAGFIQGVVGFNRAPEDLASVARLLAGLTDGGQVNVLDTLNVRAFLQLLMSLTDTNILSTPQMLAVDNRKATIHVGENRPFPTGQSQDVTGATLVTIERKDVGVKLEMTPHILENDRIRIELKQEVTAVAENVAQTIGTGSSQVAVGPTTTKRAMETTVIAQNGQTLVVGGLVRDNITINETKIPLLGDIPLLGWLFRFQSKQSEKLSLLIFLTPHIVTGETDMVKLRTRKAEEVEALQRQNSIDEPTRLKQATKKLSSE